MRDRRPPPAGQRRYDAPGESAAGRFVMLPWHRDGKVRSGLRRPCAAVATWQAEIQAGDVQQVVGILAPAVIADLLTKVAATMPPASEEPTADAPAPPEPIEPANPE